MVVVTCHFVPAVTALTEAVPALLLGARSMLCAPSCLGGSQGAWVGVHGKGQGVVINPFIPPLSSPDPPFVAVSLPGAFSSQDVRSDSWVLETPQGESLPTLLQTQQG